MQKNEIKQIDMKPLIIDSSWTERFLPDPPREKKIIVHHFVVIVGEFYILPLFVAYRRKLKFTQLAKMIFIALV